MADVSIATGWATIALMVGGRFVFQYLGWGFAASATPAVMLLTGGAFFGLSIAARLSPGSAHLAAAGVFAGAVTQVRCRGAGGEVCGHHWARAQSPVRKLHSYYNAKGCCRRCCYRHTVQQYALCVHALELKGVLKRKRVDNSSGQH